MWDKYRPAPKNHNQCTISPEENNEDLLKSTNYTKNYWFNVTENGRDYRESMFCRLVYQTKYVMLTFQRGHCLRLSLSKALGIEGKGFKYCVESEQ